jgi:histidinol-phosphatase (PHP family)
MTLTNYHSHSKWSDGKGELEDFVKEAINQKLEVYGFSEHAPVYFDCEWTMNINNFKNYSLEIDNLKLKYSNKIELLKGLEIDYLPNNPLNNKRIYPKL